MPAPLLGKASNRIDPDVNGVSAVEPASTSRIARPHRARRPLAREVEGGLGPFDFHASEAEPAYGLKVDQEPGAGTSGRHRPKPDHQTWRFAR